MTPTVPKRPRSPGRRNFSPGTDAEWDRVAQDPQVQAALNDPGISQALAQNMRAHQQAATAMPPRRFQAGGSTNEASTMQLIQMELDQLNQIANDPSASPQAKQAALLKIQQLRTTGGIAGTSGSGSSSGTSSTSSMIPGLSPQAAAGFSNLSTLGPPTAQNMIFPAALGALGGAGAYRNTPSGPKAAGWGGALGGAGIALATSYLMRRLGQQQRQNQGQQANQARSQQGIGGQTPAGGDGQGPAGGPYIEPNLNGPAGGPLPADIAPTAAMAPGLAGPEMADTSGLAGTIMNDPALAQAEVADTPPPFFARGGEVHADAAADRAQTLGILKEKKLIKARGGRIGKFATGGAEDLPPMPHKGLKGVLVRKPLGHAMPIPVLHTTIVITAKPKGKTAKTARKKKGGPIKPIKAAAVPPTKGPANGNEPASPFRKGGHVQVPRGSGAAVRGKRFSGIY